MASKIFVVFYSYYIEQGKFGGGMAMFGLSKANKGGGGLDEANRIEREKMKRNLFIGVDFIGDEEIRIKSDAKIRSRWEAFKIRMGRLI